MNWIYNFQSCQGRCTMVCGDCLKADEKFEQLGPLPVSTLGKKKQESSVIRQWTLNW